MKLLKIFILISLSLFIFSCSKVQQGFNNPKKTSSDEFLVEKKSPLVMPPDYNELPTPNNNLNENMSNKNNNKIKDLVSHSNDLNNDPSETSQTFEESLIEKMKKN